MAPKRKPDSQATPAVEAPPPPAPEKKKKPNRKRKVRYTVRKKTSKTSSASPGVKKAKNEEKEQQNPKKEAVVAADVEVVEAVAEKSSSVRLIIEHCKQCTSFKNQAAVFEKSLRDKVQGLEISINPAKPRRGCFEIRDEEGNLFVSLLDLKRPFPELKALNIEEQVEKIVSKIKK